MKIKDEDRQLPLFETEDYSPPSVLVATQKERAESPYSPFSKYIIYVDESGDHSLQSIDDNYPVFVLAFCIFHKRHYSEAIVPALEKFKFNHFGHDQVVLHENEIRKEKGEHQKKTFIVVECRGNKEDRELELEFRRISDGNNRLGIPLPFEVLFADKKAMSSGLQLADLVARPIGLKTVKPQQENRAFDVLTKKFYCDGGRNKLGQNFEGIGMKIYPAQESEKPR